MKATGYYDKGKGCFELKSYDLPGATTYPIDTLTNADNPDYVFNKLPSLDDIKNNSTLLLAGLAVAAVVLFSMMRR